MDTETGYLTKAGYLTYLGFPTSIIRPSNLSEPLPVITSIYDINPEPLVFLGTRLLCSLEKDHS